MTNFYIVEAHRKKIRKQDQERPAEVLLDLLSYFCV